MTREEAIAILDGFKYNPLLNEQHFEALDMAVTALSENKGEWIPVSERLPEKNVWVLVTVEQNDNRYQEIMRRNVYTGEWTDNIDNYTDEITAWMPLPEPYKAESEDT